MDFKPSIEQEMLRDSARQFISTEMSFERRQHRLSGRGKDDWVGFAELGWLAMAVPEDVDGLGSSVADLAVLCEEMGRGLCAYPFIGCGVLPARLLALAEHDGHRDLLAGIAGGERRVAVALYEPGRRFGVSSPSTLAERLADGSFRLNGSKLVVIGGRSADTLIVSARIVSSDSSESQLALLLVDTSEPGVSCQGYRTLDDIDAADVLFTNVSVPAANVLTFPGGAHAALDYALDEAVVCQCADLIGGMSRAVDMTSEYLHIRNQFGRPLAEFQALQHAVAELFIEVSDARSMLYQAIGAMSLGAQQRRKRVSACKVKVVAAAKEVTGMAVHLHGGIGVTAEYPVGHYLRRLMASERLFGDSEHHLQHYLEGADMGAERRAATGDMPACELPTM